jgi:uncharacterized damage-inducible protein DinB
MQIDNLIQLFKRDLEKLITEISLYKNEEAIWRTDKNIANSAGNLSLHLVGNLNTYIGEAIGKSGYIRNRELEFSLKNIPKEKLIKMIRDTIIVVEGALAKISKEQLEEEFPILVFDRKTSTQYLLLHLSTHLAYHLGQVNYHRRLLDE